MDLRVSQKTAEIVLEKEEKGEDRLVELMLITHMKRGKILVFFGR